MRLFNIQVIKSGGESIENYRGAMLGIREGKILIREHIDGRFYDTTIEWSDVQTLMVTPLT